MSRGRRPRFGLLRRLIREIHDDGVVDAAASVAFWLLLSLPAAALAVLASVSFLDAGLTVELEDALLDYVDRTFTTEADGLRSAIVGVFDGGRPGLFSLSVAVAVFTLSRGFAGMIRALDTVYDISESRRLLWLRSVALGMAVGTLLTVAASTALWAWAGRAGIPGPLRAAGALAVLVLWAATIFHIGPNHHTPWRYDLPGAMFTAAGWLAVSVGFGWYVRFAGSGNEILGAAGTLLFGLTWLWTVCAVLLIGAELNEILARRAGVVRANTVWKRRLTRAVGAVRRRPAESDTEHTAERSEP